MSEREREKETFVRRICVYMRARVYLRMTRRGRAQHSTKSLQCDSETAYQGLN